MKRLILTLLLGITTAIVVWYGFNPLLQSREPISTSTPILAVATTLPKPQTIESFSLTDTTAKPFTEKDLVGHWTLLYFGYTHCPEICPKSMAIASDFWNQLPAENRNSTRFVFITLDPEEDKISDLKTFLSRFHSDFIGATGDIAEINKLAKSCRIHSYEESTKTAQGYKNIDHTAAFILINPEGRMQALFSPPHDPINIAKDLSSIMQTRAVPK